MFLEQLRFPEMGQQPGDFVTCPRNTDHRAILDETDEGIQLWYCIQCCWGDYWPPTDIAHAPKHSVRF